MAKVSQIDSNIARTFAEDGVVHIPGLFNEWVDPLREAIAEALEHPGPYALKASERFPSEAYLNLRTDERTSAFRKISCESPAGELGAGILDSSSIFLFRSEFLVKLPDCETPTPWHHDLPYYPFTGNQMGSIWIALDEVSLETGAVEYIVGSHRWNQQYKPVHFGGGPVSFNGRVSNEEVTKSFTTLPDIEGNRDSYEIVSFDAHPGDCIVHHGLTVHGASGNSSSTTSRRAVNMRLLGDDMRYAPSAERNDLPFDPGLEVGAPVECEWFPRIWQR